MWIVGICAEEVRTVHDTVHRYIDSTSGVYYIRVDGRIGIPPSSVGEPASFFQQAGASQGQASYMSAESTPRAVRSSRPTGQQSKMDSKSSPGLVFPHNRDCLSSLSKGCQGSRLSATLPRRGQAGQAMLVSPHHPAGTCLHLAITPRTWLAQPSARCPGHVAPMWEQLQTSQGSHLDSVGAMRKFEPTSAGISWEATCNSRPNSEGRCWPPGGAPQFRRHIV